MTEWYSVPLNRDHRHFVLGNFYATLTGRDVVLGHTQPPRYGLGERITRADTNVFDKAAASENLIDPGL
jgi:hypothetical protein